MPTHELKPERGSDRWTVAWDDATFSLTTPDGETIFECPPDTVCQAIDFYELFVEGKVQFRSPAGFLKFKADKTALCDLKLLIQDNLRKDDQFRLSLKAHAGKVVPRGLIGGAAGTILFALYCWWAFTAGDLPAGHWIRWFGWLIHFALVVCLGFAIGGPVAAWFGWKQLRLIRRIEREKVEESPGDRLW